MGRKAWQPTVPGAAKESACVQILVLPLTSCVTPASGNMACLALRDMCECFIMVACSLFPG